MIEKTEIAALPFVDGTPDPSARPDQARLNWMKNGECMDAATTAISNEGSLNRAGVEIQKNVVQVHDDLSDITKTLNDVIVSVNAHEEIIGQGNNLDLIETVQKHTDEIETLNFAVVQTSEQLEKVQKIATDNHEEIGVVPSHDDADRTIRDELEWQKTEMGAYPGFDYNGMPDVDSKGAGMKNRIINNSMQISNHQARINELETNWAESDVGSLTREVNNLRSEVGPRREAMPGHTMYNRLTTVEQRTTGQGKDTKTLQEHTGLASFPRPNAVTLIELVDHNIEDLRGLITDFVSLNQRVVVVESTIGDETTTDSIVYNQKVFTTDIKDLYTIVGKDNSSGLRYSIVTLQTELGDNNIPGSVKNRVLLTEQGIRDLNIQIDDLNNLLGVDGEGSAGSIADRITELELQTNGDENGTTEFEKLGLYKVAYDIYTQKPISDAPDGKTYLRKLGVWSRLGSENITLDKNVSIGDESGNIISSGDDYILGNTNVEIRVDSEVRDLKIVDGQTISTTNSDGTKLRRQLVDIISDVNNVAVINVGEEQDTIINLKGQVRINNSPIGEGDVKDVIEEQDGYYLREHESWSRTDTIQLPVSTLVKREYTDAGKEVEGSTKIYLEQKNATVTLGSNDISAKIANLTEIKTKGLKIVDDVSTIMQTGDSRVTFGRPLYVGTDRVWTDGTDAPKDGEFYARKDGSWTKFDPTGEGSGSGISEAPNDGRPYVRKDFKWEALGSEDVLVDDNVSVKWEVSPKNWTGMHYAKVDNTLIIGGSGAKVSFAGDLDTLVIGEGEGILQKDGSNQYSLVLTDSDKNLYVGESVFTKAVTLRGEEDPKAQVGTNLYTLWHSGNDAPKDAKIYGRKNGAWTPFEVNRTLDVILNQGYSFKVADSKNKLMTVATAGIDNLIELGQKDTLMNIDSTVRSLKLDNKVVIKSTDGVNDINLIGLNDDAINLGDQTKDLRLHAKTLKVNGADIWTSASDAPKDGNKYVRHDGKWNKAYEYGADAPNSVGAKEGDVYFQYM